MSQANSVSKGTFWCVVVLVLLIESVRFFVCATPGEINNVPVNRQHLDQLRTKQIILVDDNGDEAMRLETSPVRYRGEDGVMRRESMSRFQMRCSGNLSPSFEFTLSPDLGPTLRLTHPKSGSECSVSCIERDVFSLSFGTADPPTQALRIHVNNQKQQLEILDSRSRRLILLETGDHKPNSPTISILSDATQPVQVQKHPQVP